MDNTRLIVFFQPTVYKQPHSLAPMATKSRHIVVRPAVRSSIRTMFAKYLSGSWFNMSSNKVTRVKRPKRTKSFPPFIQVFQEYLSQQHHLLHLLRFWLISPLLSRSGESVEASGLVSCCASGECIIYERTLPTVLQQLQWAITVRWAFRDPARTLH